MSNSTKQQKRNFLICQIALALSDFIAFQLSAAFALYAVSWTDIEIHNFIPTEEVMQRLWGYLLLSAFGIAWFWIRLHHYTYRKTFWFELKETLRTILILAVIELCILALSKLYVSRYVWMLTWGSLLFILPTLRIITKKILNAIQVWQRQAIIIGSGRNASDTYHALQDDKSLGFNVSFFFSPTPLVEAGKAYKENIRLIDKEAMLWRMTNRQYTHFLLAMDEGEGKLRNEWLKKLAVRKCRSVTVVPTIRGLPLDSTDASFIFKHELLLLRVHHRLNKKFSRFIKRCFDIIVSLILLVLLSPILGLFALLIRLTGSPVFFKHQRIGRDGQLFSCIKFSSMVSNAEEILQQLLQQTPKLREEWNREHKLRNDPRVTRIGGFLRKTSLDELPQLLNVLRGEMSLVGPRPITAEELELYGENKEYYLMAKPGMTGLWQVSGRNLVSYDKRVYFDAWYVKNWSLWNDVMILFKTVTVVLTKDGAF